MSKLTWIARQIHGPQRGDCFTDEEWDLMGDNWCLGKGGGGSGGPQTVNNSGLPDYAQPYYEDLMQRAQTATTEEYIPYEGQRIADRSADTLAGYDAARAGIGVGSAGIGAGMDGTAAITSNVMANTPGIWGSNVTAGTFPGANLDAYMNPYTANVIDRSMSELGRQNEIALAQIRNQAGQAGAFGGGRHGILEGQQYGNYLRSSGDLAAQLWNQNFDNAQKAIAADQDRLLKGDLSNQANSLEAQRLNTEAFLNANQLGMAGMKQYSDLAQALQTANMTDSTTLRDLGREQELYNQTMLDQAYEDFVNQRDYPYQQLNRYSGYLQGLPLGQQSEVYTNPNPWAQALGLGIGGLSLYKMFNGG